MATTVNDDMVIYNDLAQTAYLERRQDNMDVFGRQSGGAILLINELILGDERRRAFTRIGGSILHRDVNSTAAVASKKIDSDEMVDIKTPWVYGPYATTEEQYKRRAVSMKEFARMVGQDMADASMEGFIAAGLSSVIAAVTGNPDMVVAGSIATDGKKTLTKAMRTFGDRFSRIGAFVMDATAYLDFVDQAIEAKIYEEAGVVVYGGSPGTMGKPVLVTDRMPANKILALQAGAVTITESQAPGVRFYDINTEANLALGYRAEGAYNVGLLGYSWDTGVGGINPPLAALASAANWKKHAANNKSTAGALINLT